MVRASFYLAMVLLAGCSCCNDRFYVRTFVVDDATARRVNGGQTPRAGYSIIRELCAPVCDVLGGRTDPGPVDADVPDSGAPPPPAPVSGCFLRGSSPSWTLECEYGAGCPV